MAEMCFRGLLLKSMLAFEEEGRVISQECCPPLNALVLGLEPGIPFHCATDEEEMDVVTESLAEDKD